MTCQNGKNDDDIAKRTLDRNHEVSQLYLDRIGIQQKSITRSVNLRVPSLNRVQGCFRTQRLEGKTACEVLKPALNKVVNVRVDQHLHAPSSAS